jgi:hypothetical protein
VAGIVKDSTSGRNGYRGPYQLKPASHGTYPILFFAFGGDKGIKRGLFNGCQEFPARKRIIGITIKKVIPHPVPPTFFLPERIFPEIPA